MSSKPARRTATAVDADHKLHREIRQPGGMSDHDLLLVSATAYIAAKHPTDYFVVADICSLGAETRRCLSELVGSMREAHELSVMTHPSLADADRDRAQWHRAAAALYGLLADSRPGLAEKILAAYRLPESSHGRA